MIAIIEWLENYNAEYDVASQILYIRKPMLVSDFIVLKKILEKYRYKLKDIIIESW